MWDDWLDAVYLRIEVESNGGYKPAELDRLPIWRVMQMAEMFIDRSMMQAEIMAAMAGATIR
jgi:hypothetical protein